MPLRDDHLEERSEDEPKYNPHNKTDRRLLMMLLSIAFIVLVIVVTLIVCYYEFWK
ncbi:MAG: hypothetical protein LUC31_00065 [Coprobacillus sp.]|nr:hypothetical protein [Coprobacillus sp.]